MHNSTPGCYRSFRALAVVVLLASCSGSNDQVPFPAEESEFLKPVSRPFKLGQPIPIEWEEFDPKSLKPLPVKKFNLSAIPRKPFNIGNRSPLKAPLAQKLLDWKHLPDTVFDLNNLPTQPLRTRTILMQPPAIIKAGFPAAKTGATRGVMATGAGLGLPGYGRCFLQEPTGLFWIGTDKGLYRYDGVNLEIYGQEQGLADPNIWSILRDPMGRIWMGTTTGKIFILDRDSGLIHELIDKFPEGPVFNMTQDTEGRVWATRGDHGVSVTDEKNQTVKSLGVHEGLPKGFKLDILIDKRGRIWLTSGDGVTVLDLNKKTNKRITAEQGLISNTTFALMEDDLDNIWIGGVDGLNIIHQETGRIQQLSRSQGLTMSRFVIGICMDRSGTAWVGTNDGNVFSFNPKGGWIEKYELKVGDNFPFNLLEDSEEQIWIGTTGLGCYVINQSHGRPGQFTKEDGLGSVSIWSIVESRDGQLWIGTNDGIDVYDPATKTVRHLGTQEGLRSNNASGLYIDSKGQIWVHGGAGMTIIDPSSGTIKYLGKEQGLKQEIIDELVEDSAHNLWLGSFEGQVYQYNFERKVYRKIRNLPTWAGGRVYDILVDSKQQIWIGNEIDGVVVISADGKTMKRLTTSEGLLGNRVYNFLEAADGIMWIGTSNGANRLDLQQSSITNFTTQEGLVDNEIWTLNERNRTIYLGTTRGLTMLSPRDGATWSVTSFGKPQGLPFLDFDLNSGLVTRNGEFWAGVEIQILLVMDEPRQDTDKPKTFVTGFAVLDQKISIDDRDLTASHLMKVDTVWKSEAGRFYENKEAALQVRFKPTPLKWDSVDWTYRMPINLQLPYDQNYMNFSFAGTNLSDPDKIRYRYILQGIDKTWSAITANSFSENYRDLPPGNYTFKVCSRGLNGLWSEPATFSFSILPPLWQTWWAYGVYLVIFAGLGWRVHLFQKAQTVKRERERVQERELAQAKEIEKAYNELKATQSQLIQSEKMASLGELTAGIAHEIQNPLNFVNNFSEVNKELIQEMKTELEQGHIEDAQAIAKSIMENEEKILFHGKRADSIVKGMLQHSRASSGVKEPTDINALTDEYLRLAYHGLRAKDKSFNAVMKTDLDPNLGKISVVPQDLGRVILNLITNGFYAVTEKKKSQQNGYEPTVTVSTRKAGDKVRITVQDNGNGIPQNILDKIFQPFFTTKPSGQGTGLGLSMSYDIVTKVHGGKIDVETRPGEGTSFILTIPNQSA